MHVLRAEKGYIIVGQDTDGTVTPDDAGLSWAIGKKKPDFVGKRSLSRPDLVASGRKQLVGLLTDDPNTVLEEGAQIVADPNEAVPMKMIGHVTSSYWSEALGRSIAMAVIEDGRALTDKTLHIPMPDETLSAKVTSPIFYDPDGSRLGDPSRFDYVVVVGGLVDEIENLHPDYVGFLHRAATSKVPLVGVCTGAFILYRAGLMDGYRCCVSWFHHDDFLGQFDGMEPVSDQIFVVDRDRLTASGGVSSAHLAAYLVDRHVGRAEARKSLNIMIIDEAMSAEAAQPGLPLELTTSDDLVRRALLLMQQAMSAPLPMSVIAKRLDVSRRKLERHFDRALGMSPAVADKLVRLTHARFLLRTPHHSIAEVAADTGFCDASHFVKVFKGYYGVTPRQLAADATRSEKSSVSADP